MTKRHTITRTRAKTLRQTMTEPERRLWAMLRAGRTGIKFQRQVVIAPYIADFAARSERLIVEIDGDSHAGQESYDAARTAVLHAQGYRVLRFTNADIMGNVDGVVRAILIAIGHDPDTPLSPTLSP